MKEKLENGEAIDVSACEKNENGDYILTNFEEDVDYCDSVNEWWIWSIGKNYTTGQILASTNSKFYQNKDYKCLFLR
jgi:hypothetical protein